jgi:hypothetical protein
MPLPRQTPAALPSSSENSSQRSAAANKHLLLAEPDQRHPVSKFYTRPQIAAFYEQHRKGLWAGREAEWQRLEADFCAASAEGRIQGPDYLTK